jgi:hypothetical protein
MTSRIDEGIGSAKQKLVVYASCGSDFPSYITFGQLVFFIMKADYCELKESTVKKVKFLFFSQLTP